MRPVKRAAGTAGSPFAHLTNNHGWLLPQCSTKINDNLAQQGRDAGRAWLMPSYAMPMRSSTRPRRLTSQTSERTMGTPAT